MATTGDKVRAKCVVIPIETCDEGFEHIQSDIGKRLGGSALYELVDSLQGDQVWYNSSLSTDDTAGGVNMISGDYENGATAHTADVVWFVFVRNTTSNTDMKIGINGSVTDAIYLAAGESVAVKLHSVTVDELHIWSTLDGTAEVFAVCGDVA